MQAGCADRPNEIYRQQTGFFQNRPAISYLWAKLRSCVMGNWTQIVPGGTSRTVYLVPNDFGRLGRSYLETGEDEADLETIISGMLARS